MQKSVYGRHHRARGLQRLVRWAGVFIAQVMCIITLARAGDLIPENGAGLMPNGQVLLNPAPENAAVPATPNNVVEVHDRTVTYNVLANGDLQLADPGQDATGIVIPQYLIDYLHDQARGAPLGTKIARLLAMVTCPVWWPVATAIGCVCGVGLGICGTCVACRTGFRSCSEEDNSAGWIVALALMYPLIPSRGAYSIFCDWNEPLPRSIAFSPVRPGENVSRIRRS